MSYDEQRAERQIANAPLLGETPLFIAAAASYPIAVQTTAEVFALCFKKIKVHYCQANTMVVVVHNVEAMRCLVCDIIK